MGLGKLKEDVWEATPIKITEEISKKGFQDLKIKCSSTHSVIHLNTEGIYRTLVTGNNRKGQIGFHNKNENKFLDEFEEIEFLKNQKIDIICCGEDFTIFLLPNNQLFAFGDSNFISLFSSKSSSSSPSSPVLLDLVQLDEKIVSIKNGFSHLLVLTESGRVFSGGNFVFLSFILIIFNIFLFFFFFIFIKIFYIYLKKKKETIYMESVD